MSERETSCLRIWRQLVLCGFWSGGYRSCWTGSSWSSGLWPMAIFFSLIFLLSLLSTKEIPPLGGGACSWKMRPMWWRSRVALAKREGESSMWSRKYRAYSLPCSAASVNQRTADSLSCGMSLPSRYSLPRAYYAYWFPCSADSISQRTAPAVSFATPSPLSNSLPSRYCANWFPRSAD